MRNRDRGRSYSMDNVNETTLNKQLKRIYLDQQKRRRGYEKKRKRLDKFGGCCVLM